METMIWNVFRQPRGDVGLTFSLSSSEISSHSVVSHDDTVARVYPSCNAKGIDNATSVEQAGCEWSWCSTEAFATHVLCLLEELTLYAHP